MQPRDLSDHVAYEAGRGIEEVARELDRDPEEFVKLASNENPHGPSPAAAVAIRETASNASSYPKAAHADLTTEIADRWAVADEQVWLANGGDGAIDYLSRAVLEPGDSTLVPSPGFAYYGMSARFHHGEVREYELSKDDDFSQDAETVLESYDGDRIVYLTSPHNPSGSTIPLKEVVEIAERTDEKTLVVVDEAYGEFADRKSAVAPIEGRDGFEARDDIAVLRTFSKAYGLAGVRLGYAVVPDEWADAYARVNTPFAASELACRAGLAAIDDDEHVQRTVETASDSRAYMRDNLETHVWESEGNFVLVDVGDAERVAEETQERGVIVRDCTSFGLPDCLRITCGTETETERAVETINEVLAELELEADGNDTGVTDA
ncbi:histidinol-phosphate transaminase [Natronobacterium gregoryi]|uniref:Histidinol-phosphate aminotransferase n=2 Tax=Natronobacterium gregoryi TaxID=44930 RepID=L0AMN0_NATGS|nr:histidinol-phosphate transaminase [Natronobacterium gregoryi]AFZ74714.1 histidinol-phosphate aminotransferase [Natronobacterium gregoryi SP2]ELY73380.1 histidinol-phosphate aminotransferase [Natronobacterium gregoryi SP2]PLK20958.1 histidinol-phosphate transaminase [Natronobacterium gregoryi SP2]SFJ04251.1 histidinol-phosphate aminotransferase [Natronobacterium gregoryi]